MHQTKKGFIIGSVVGLVWSIMALFILAPSLQGFSTQNTIIGIFLILLSLPVYFRFIGCVGPQECDLAPGIVAVILSIIVFGLIGAIIGRFIRKKELQI